MTGAIYKRLKVIGEELSASDQRMTYPPFFEPKFEG
jgi:hypothetical protein